MGENMANDISQRIKNMAHTFSKGQKKLANAIMNDYDKVAYMTAAGLGKYVSVSESTVVRFAGALGFNGYVEFQRAVQELVRMSLTPNQRIEITKKRIGRGDVLEKVMGSDIGKLRYTLDTLNREAFYKSIDAILEAKNIYIIGARSSGALAQMLDYNLSLIFDNVRFVRSSSVEEIFEQMYSISENDVLIAFSFPRYSTRIVKAVKYARKCNAKVVAFTDSVISPIAEYASFLLAAESDMASFMDSLVAPISIINAIIVEITNRRERQITQRFDKLESIWDEYGVYTKR